MPTKGFLSSIFGSYLTYYELKMWCDLLERVHWSNMTSTPSNPSISRWLPLQEGFYSRMACASSKNLFDARKSAPNLGRPLNLTFPLCMQRIPSGRGHSLLFSCVPISKFVSVLFFPFSNFLLAIRKGASKGVFYVSSSFHHLASILFTWDLDFSTNTWCYCTSWISHIHYHSWTSSGARRL